LSSLPSLMRAASYATRRSVPEAPPDARITA
jgi:hypothetical protein